VFSFGNVARPHEPAFVAHWHEKAVSLLEVVAVLPSPATQRRAWLFGFHADRRARVTNPHFSPHGQYRRLAGVLARRESAVIFGK
jgi:hypothetical protein